MDIVLCPGVAVMADAAPATGNEKNNVSDAQAIVDGLSSSSSESGGTNVEGEYGQGWEELPSETAQEIIQMLVPSTIASKLANSISDTYYLTSDSYGNTTAEMGCASFSSVKPP